jgi:hypothetical protein
MVLTGLRGVGKTVLMDSLKPRASAQNWLWVGTDLSESASLSEDRLAVRLLTDLAVITSGWTITKEASKGIGFHEHASSVVESLSFDYLRSLYETTPGLPHDKLKAVLEFVWIAMKQSSDLKGIVFGYDEAQTMSDHVDKDEYPLALLLDVFQSIQKKGIRFMLVLTGLPTLFPKLVEARTFAERMFHVVVLSRLDESDSRDAITIPIKKSGCPVVFTDESVAAICDMSAGYPYFIQFICKECYDAFIAQASSGTADRTVPIREIVGKLDVDFFAGRWARATDRQRDLMCVIASLDNHDDEFTVQEIVQRSKVFLAKSFTSSHVNQMLSSLGESGLVYKNRHGRYLFAVPLLGGFIQRQPAYQEQTESLHDLS